MISTNKKKWHTHNKTRQTIQQHQPWNSPWRNNFFKMTRAMPSHGAVPVFGRAPPTAQVAWRPQGACPFLDLAISNEALKLCTCLSNQHQDYDMDVYFKYIYIYLLYNMNIIPITIKGLDQVEILPLLDSVSSKGGDLNRLIWAWWTIPVSKHVPLGAFNPPA